MKKLLTRLFLGALLCALVLVGCNKQQPPKKQPAAATTKAAPSTAAKRFVLFVEVTAKEVLEGATAELQIDNGPSFSQVVHGYQNTFPVTFPAVKPYTMTFSRGGKHLARFYACCSGNSLSEPLIITDNFSHDPKDLRMDLGTDTSGHDVLLTPVPEERDPTKVNFEIATPANMPVVLTFWVDGPYTEKVPFRANYPYLFYDFVARAKAGNVAVHMSYPGKEITFQIPQSLLQGSWVWGQGNRSVWDRGIHADAQVHIEKRVEVMPDGQDGWKAVVVTNDGHGKFTPVVEGLTIYPDK